MHLPHGFGNGRQIGDIIDGHSKILVQQHNHVLVGVAKGQETQTLLRPLRGNMVQILQLGHNVVVGEHHAFRNTCGAGSVNNHRTVLLAIGGTQLREFSLIEVRTTEFQQLIPERVVFAVNERIDILQRRKFGRHRLHLAHHNLSFKNDQLGLTVVQDVFVILGRDGRINRHQHRTNLRDGHLGDGPLRTVGGNNRHLVAFGDTLGEQGTTQLVSRLFVLLGSIFVPLVLADLTRQGNLLIRMPLLIAEHNVIDTFQFHSVSVFKFWTAKRQFFFLSPIKL